MTQEDPKRVSREGIVIERDLAEALAIEEELDSSVVGPYRFPSPGRRRISGWVLLVGAVLCAWLIELGWIPALGFVALAAWQFLSAWDLEVDDHQALERAAAAVDFPVGHASAAVTFKGWRSRPRWSVILYSAAEPPDRRALVVIDAVTGNVVEDVYAEDVPDV